MKYLLNDMVEQIRYVAFYLSDMESSQSQIQELGEFLSCEERIDDK